MIKMKERLLSTVLIITLGIGVSGCGNSSEPDLKVVQKNQETTSSPVDEKNDVAYTKKKETHLSAEPSSFRKYALVASGKIDIKNKLTTDGPLADVHANGPIVANTRSLNISGRITSKNELTDAITRSFNYESNIANKDIVSIRALKVNEFINLNNITQYYSLNKNGKITKIEDNVITEISSIDGAQISYKDGTWNIRESTLKISDNIKVEGNLKINSDYTFISGALMVSGNLTSTGELNINVGTPFDSALVVNKSIVVEKLTTIGRVHSSGNFTAKDTVNIVGNAEIDGDVELHGDAKINMLDNVYKAALADAQEEAEQTKKDVTLVHSKLFSNVKGSNSVVLFTFVEGNYLMNEKTLNDFIASNEIKDFNFKSYLYGASIDYTSQLTKSDIISDYYQNLQAIIKLLTEEHGDVKVVNHIDIAPSNLYCTFADTNGNKIGTYLISSLDSFDVTKLVELSEDEIKSAIEILDNPEKAVEDFENSIDLQDTNSSELIDIATSDLNSSIKDEYETEQNNISTSINAIDKEALKAENTKNRINEWVQYQELGTENRVVDIEEVVQGSDGKQRGWFKKLRKKVKKFFRKITLTDCRKKTDTRQIWGVNNNTSRWGGMNDRWGQDVSLWNRSFAYCGPTAASMVMQYNAHVRKGKASLYNNDVTSRTMSLNNYDSGYNSYVATWANKLHTGRTSGTSAWSTVWRLPYNIYKEHKRLGMSGWAYTYYTSVWNRAWQHNLVKWYIKKNNPTIISVWKGKKIQGHQDIGENHMMPVIGYKTESYSGWCAKRIWPNKKWLLVDTEFRYKGYIRFDSRSEYFRFGAMTYIRSY